MPELKAQLKHVEVTLPDSGAKCKIGLSYGDHLRVQRVLTGEMKFKIGGKRQTGPDGKPLPEDNVPEQEITGDLLQKETQEMILAGLKEWDFTTDGQPAPIDWDNISLLSKTDGEFLKEEIGKLSASAGVPDESKKK